MEYRRICKVCGKIYCYTDQEVKDSKKNAALGVITAIGGLASLVGGTTLDTMYFNHEMDKHSEGVRDFTKCPGCGSQNTDFYTGDLEGDSFEQKALESGKHLEINTNATPEALIKRASLFMEEGEWDSAKAYCNAVLDTDPENAGAYLAMLMADLQVYPAEKLAECDEPFEDNINYKRVLRFADEQLVACLKDYNEQIKARNAAEYKEALYTSAVSTLNSSKDGEKLEKTVASLNEILGYKDAESIAEKCRNKAEECRKNAIYDKACHLMQEEESSSCEEAIMMFSRIEGWRDADTCLEKCKVQLAALREQEEKQLAENARIRKYIRSGVAVLIGIIVMLSIICNVIIPYSRYNAAMKLRNSGKYDEAIAAFTAMNGYKDSKEQITYCNYDKDYAAAAALMAFGQYEEAISAFTALKGYSDSEAQITACETAIKDAEYDAAAALLGEGKYSEAYTAFLTLQGYKDVDTLLATDENLKAAAAAAYIAQFDVGNIVTMGSYGGEAVEWLVMAAEGDTRTMIAVKGQDAVCFNKSSSDGNQWETSYIRTWLNETYYNEAFSAEEQTMITAGPTGDKVWLLSVDEVNKYFADGASRVCYPSAHAKKNGASTTNSGAGWWWLRLPGSHPFTAANVSSNGGVSSNGSSVDFSDVMARPVVVVSVESVGLY